MNKSITYSICEMLIKQGKTQQIQNKVDVFYANNRLTEKEYTELCLLIIA